MAYGYAWSRDAETWDKADVPLGSTREDAAAWALATEEGLDYDTVYICARKPVDKLPSLLRYLEAERVLEAAEEQASDDCTAIWWEDNLYASSPEAKQALTDLLEAAAKVWLHNHPGPEVWEADAITKHDREVTS